MMATICEIVLCLPKPSAARTTCLETANSRNPVMASARATTTTTIHAGIQFSPTKAMKAEQSMILSASGSMRTPKLVMSFRRRAIFAVQEVAHRGGDEERQRDRLVILHLREHHRQKGDGENEAGDGQLVRQVHSDARALRAEGCFVRSEERRVG